MQQSNSSRLAWIAVACLAVAAPAGAQSGYGGEERAPGGGAAQLGHDDWSAVRAVHEAERHAIRAVEAGHRARNPGQRWTTSFDGRGFETEPDCGAWTWGFALERYGWGEDRQELCEPRSVSVEGGRLAYAWNERLSEWYVNDARGLEHGFSVTDRPPEADSGATLQLELSVRGALRARLHGDGCGASFLDRDGAVVLTYDGLAAFDADRRRLPARLELTVDGIRLTVDERGARYPIWIDPLAQQAYLKASNTNAGDNFGTAIAMWGDTVAVGAREEDSSATGVNGNQADNSANRAGAVYVFVRSGGTWVQQAYLKASNTNAEDNFGGSLELWGDTLVVGASAEDSNATGVDGDQGNNSASEAGAAYVFVRNGSTWSQQAYLKASNTQAGDFFGGSVSIRDDTLVIAATGEDGASAGVDGDQSSNGAQSSGAVYVFVRNGTAWVQQAYIKASNPGSFDTFGGETAIDGDTLVVSAGGEDSSATGVDGDQNDNGATEAGAAYVFARSGPTWSQQAYVKASNTGIQDVFGNDVSISGDTLVVGCRLEDSSATGVNGDPHNDGTPSSGAVFVFTRNGTAWTQEAYLKASNSEIGDYFGWSVDVWGDRLLVGAIHEDGGSTGIGGDQHFDSALDSGAVYLFGRSGTQWFQTAYVKASNSETDDGFGWAVSITADSFVASSDFEDSNATGVNGNSSNDSAPSSGAAFVFTIPEDVTAYCFGDGSGTACPCGNSGAPAHGCANSMGAGGLLAAAGGTSVSAGALVLQASGLAPNAAGVFMQGDAPGNGGAGSPFGDGLLCVGQNVKRLQGVLANGFGMSSSTIDIAASANVLPGDTRYYQLWYRDVTGGPCGSGFNLTNALEVYWNP